MSTPGGALPPASSFLAVPAAPMTFGRLLDRIFQLLGANWHLFLGIASVPAAGFLVLEALITGAVFSVVQPWHPHTQPHFSGPISVGLFLSCMAVYVLMMAIFALYDPAGTYAALQANAGAKATFKESWAVAWRKAGRYIWLAILKLLLIGLPIAVLAAVVGGFVALSIARTGGNSSPDTWLPLLVPAIILLYTAGLVLAILVYLRVVVATPACVTEDVSAWTAIRRSNQLTKGAKGRIFLLWIVLYAIIYAFTLVLEILVFFLAGIGFLVGTLAHIALVPWGLVGIGVIGVILVCAFFLMIAATWALYMAATAVVYHDQRLRSEGVAAARVAPLERPA